MLSANNSIRRLIAETQDKILRSRGIERELESVVMRSTGSKPIKIITGFRRSGKSFLTQQIARKLVDRGDIKIENTLYLNFEDYRLMEFLTPEAVDHLFSVFRQSATDGRYLLIFDEIQNVKNWDKFLRTLYEREENIEFIITGSNSELLSAELGSNLAGRFIEFFLYPFSFAEFLHYRGKLSQNGTLSNRNESAAEKLFYEYIMFGGLPEVFDIPSSEAKLSYIQGVLTKVVLDDVVKRFRVDNVILLEKLLYYILATVGNVTSYKSLEKRCALLSVKVKYNTLIDYISYLIKSFAIFEVSKFSWKQGRFFSTSRKYYAVDTSLSSIVRGFDENHQFRLENIIYLELKRRGGELFYGVDDIGKEIDFVVKDKGGWSQYQICEHLTEDNKKRELGAFLNSSTYLGDNRFVLTFDEGEETLIFEGMEIKRKNILKWLIDK